MEAEPRQPAGDPALAAALAELWQDIEGAVSALESSSGQRDPLVLGNVLDLLVGEVIPRMRAETTVLLPIVGAPPEETDEWSRRRREQAGLPSHLRDVADGAEFQGPPSGSAGL